jgi:hypothetical protein
MSFKSVTYTPCQTYAVNIHIFTSIYIYTYIYIHTHTHTGKYIYLPNVRCARDLISVKRDLISVERDLISVKRDLFTCQTYAVQNERTTSMQNNKSMIKSKIWYASSGSFLSGSSPKASM